MSVPLTSLFVRHAVPAVTDVEAVCPGVQDCYHMYDRGLEVALYRKDYQDFCQ